MVYVEITTSMETVLAEQFLKLQERMRYLDEENARIKAENDMLSGQLHDICEKSDDADNKDVKGKGRWEEKKEDEESEVRETRHHSFETKCGLSFRNSKRPPPMKPKNSKL